MIVVALDPGHTTGYAVVDSIGTLLESGQFPYATGAEALLHRFGHTGNVFVCESFRLRKAAAVIGSDIKTIEVVGVIKYLTWRAGHILVMQQPAQKAFYTDARLKRLGLYQVGKPHATDAIRHALFYITFAGKTYTPPN